jgi:hypothetical protein
MSTAKLPQAIRLLIMYGAAATIENKYKQTPVYLTLSEECAAQFDQLASEGDLCRTDLKDRLKDDREEALRLEEQRADAKEAQCVA